MITLAIRYTINPNKLGDFKEYVAAELEPIRQSGGKVMGRVVIPLSRVHRNPFSLKMMVIGIVIHIFCVGLPISTTIKRFSAS